MKNRLTTTLTLAVLLVASATVLEAGWEEGVVAFKGGNYQQAAKEFQGFVDERPDVFQGHYMLGQSLAKLGRNQEALTKSTLGSGDTALAATSGGKICPFFQKGKCKKGADCNILHEQKQGGGKGGGKTGGDGKPKGGGKFGKPKIGGKGQDKGNNQVAQETDGGESWGQRQNRAWARALKKARKREQQQQQ